MATPWADPRTGRLHLRRQVALRAAFGGRAIVKVALGTADPAQAKARFARENAAFEERLADARRRIADGTLAPDPKALAGRWFKAAAVDGWPPAPRRTLLALLSVDLAACAWLGDDVPVATPTEPIDWRAAVEHSAVMDRYVRDHYRDDPDRVGSWWAGVRWEQPAEVWRPFLAVVVDLLKRFDTAAHAFADRALEDALIAQLDLLQPERPWLSPDARRPKRERQSRLRPTLRLGQLFDEWNVGRLPRAQTAAEYGRVVEDFVESHGDVPVATIDPDMLFDFRDALAKLPKSMPRKDRELPFSQRIAKHAATVPKSEPATVKKAVGGLQALLTYGFQMRWLARNEGRGINVEGYSKVNRRHRRSFQDAEMAKLFSSSLFLEPSRWEVGTSRYTGCTLFWLFLIGATTGARLEEIGQAAVADVRRDGGIVYLDIDDLAAEGDPDKHVKTEGSLRLVPIHDRLVETGFGAYLDALVAAGQTRLFPDLTPGTFGKRTQGVSQRIGRVIDAVVGDDRRLVFHSFRHTFRALGTDAGLSPRVIDQICGHAPVDVASRYGSEPRIGTIHRELHRIAFPIPWTEIIAACRDLDWPAAVRGSTAASGRTPRPSG